MSSECLSLLTCFSHGFFFSIFNLLYDKRAFLNSDETKHSSVPDNTFFWEPSLSDLQYLGYSFRQLRLMYYIQLLFGVVGGEGERRLVTQNTGGYQVFKLLPAEVFLCQ